MPDSQIAEFSFDELEESDLVVDAVYRGGDHDDVRDDPIHPLLGVGNMGGFRIRGSAKNEDVDVCVLYSELTDPDWPDTLYPESGRFVYYGDNKRPGHSLHDTQRKGNLVLRQMFEALHSGDREDIPPVFVFTKAGRGRDVVFRGLAVPGAPDVAQTEDLVAIWKTSQGSRFQNYRAVFTILDVPRIARAWLDDLVAGKQVSEEAPDVWLEWRDGGAYEALAAPRTVAHRSPKNQLPQEKNRQELLEAIVTFYEEHPDGRYAFEKCAANLLLLMDDHYESVDLTRPWRDGGRDAVGEYRIGTSRSSLTVEFALEAKCKNPKATNSSGVRQTSRLISRIRHRQFGVFLTTSCISQRAYKEIVEDDHPILVLSGADVSEILMEAGLNTPSRLREWLQSLDD